MGVLLDRCTPNTLLPHFAALPEFEVVHASTLPWGEETNGRLIRAAPEAGFDAMLTVDRNMPHQTHLPETALPVLLIVARKNTVAHLAPSIPRTMAAIPNAPRGIYTVIPLLEEPTVSSPA